MVVRRSHRDCLLTYLDRLSSHPTRLPHPGQIYDVDIDRVNKPFLPVAAGELSTKACDPSHSPVTASTAVRCAGAHVLLAAPHRPTTATTAAAAAAGHGRWW